MLVFVCVSVWVVCICVHMFVHVCGMRACMCSYHAAGISIEPPMELPILNGDRHAATAAAPPPVDPPGVRSV